MLRDRREDVGKGELDGEELDVEGERRGGGDQRRDPFRAVGVLRQARELAALPDLRDL